MRYRDFSHEKRVRLVRKCLALPHENAGYPMAERSRSQNTVDDLSRIQAPLLLWKATPTTTLRVRFPLRTQFTLNTYVRGEPEL